MLTEQNKINRQNGIGATDCAAILNLSPYLTPYQLWLDKTGRQKIDTIMDENKLRLRHAHEQTIADEYSIQKGVKLRRVNITTYHKKYPYLLCHLDRVVQGQHKIVECKSSSGYMRQHWGQTNTDEIPPHYILQVQHQLACSGYDEADLAALIDIDDYRIYPIPRNQNIINKIESECERFWNEHVLADVAPEPSNRDDIKLMYPLNNGDFIECTDEILNYLNELNFTKNEMKLLDQKKNEIETEILNFIGHHDGIKHEDKVLATFTANKNGNRTLRIKI